MSTRAPLNALSILLWVLASLPAYVLVDNLPEALSDKSMIFFTIIVSTLLIVLTVSLVVMGVNIMKQKPVRRWAIAAGISFIVVYFLIKSYFAII